MRETRGERRARLAEDAILERVLKNLRKRRFRHGPFRFQGVRFRIGRVQLDRDGTEAFILYAPTTLHMRVQVELRESDLRNVEEFKKALQRLAVMEVMAS